ncbi:MAG: NUDIX hydrolase [Solobacterium sp.]|nr:NUDIX hydrolase [Solobacterium sp.]
MTRKLTSNQLDKNGQTEEEFLRLYNPDKYPKPSLTADICVIVDRSVLLIRRGGHPFLNYWALPGGFANRNEDLRSTAERELEEETGLTIGPMKLIGVYSAPGRDPRGWVVSAAYGIHLTSSDVTVTAGDDASDAEWFHIESTEPLTLTCGTTILHEEDLAFDHAVILQDAIRELKL